MSVSPSFSQSANQLGHETSPYLLQHKGNPVHWMAWGPDAFVQATAQNKPILLSVGYAACHWCHVMAHESFENPQIAAVMNELFVSIKVDREERPDIDQIYQNALALLGQSGGWPLTMFLTPDREPFWGGTYFPPAPRYGRPGFEEVLRGVAAAYRREPETIQHNVTMLKDALGQLNQNQARQNQNIDASMLDHVAERLAQEMDPVHGGIGRAPKFPQAGVFTLLWRAGLRTGHQPYRDAVITTLTRMSQGGIYDHLGGGFARYAVDEAWLTPHFEKMLYDNAQLIELLTLVWQDTHTPLFAARVRETAAWVLREMVAEEGGFASTLDADSEGEEGKFYVWREAEIDELLGSDAALFKHWYSVTPQGNFEGATILNRLDTTALGDIATEASLAALRQVLFKARAHRIRPGWDDKILADWNGLMIAALANAGMVFEEPAWITAAERAFRFVRGHMTEDGGDNRLGHSWRAGQLKHMATLDDYASMARAALMLYEALGDDSLLAQARAWVTVLDRHYWDETAGGYFFTADDAAGLILRIKNAHDTATPSGNGAMVAVLARLYLLTGEDAYRRRADELVAAFAGEAARNIFPLAGLLNAIDLLHDPLQVVLIGDAAQTYAMRRVVLERSLPNRVLSVIPTGVDLPATHPAHGKGRLGEAATAYVCAGMACSLPVTDPQALAALLTRR